MNSTLAIEFATNMFGTVKPDIKKRLQAVIDNPCQETWDDAASILISFTGRPKTLWNAVLEVDPSFTRRKPCDGAWPSIPSRETIIKAIQQVTLGKLCNPQ